MLFRSIVKYNSTRGALKAFAGRGKEMLYLIFVGLIFLINRMISGLIDPILEKWAGDDTGRLLIKLVLDVIILVLSIPIAVIIMTTVFS